MRIRKDTKYFYPKLVEAIAMSHKRTQDIVETIGMAPHTWSRRIGGVIDWRLGEMLDLRALLAPDMTLDELFQRKEV